MRHRIFLVPALMAVLGALSCSGQNLKDPDGDDDRTRARPFRTLGPTEDELNVDKGDIQDWRVYVSPEDSDVVMTVSVGKWSPSTMVGKVTLFNEVGDVLVEKPIPLGQATVDVPFHTEAGKKYYARFMSTSGAGPYAVEVKRVGDPCRACKETEECDKEAQKCVPKKPCGGTCTEDEECNAETNACVKKDKCKDVKCGKGQFCDPTSGSCRSGGKEKRPKGHKGVAGGCEPDEVEKDGKCERKATSLRTEIIDVRASGDGSYLTLNVGRDRGVNVGMSGKIIGVKKGFFKIVEVYPSRCKAKSGARVEDIGEKRQATVHLDKK